MIVFLDESEQKSFNIVKRSHLLQSNTNTQLHVKYFSFQQFSLA